MTGNSLNVLLLDPRMAAARHEPMPDRVEHLPEIGSGYDLARPFREFASYEVALRDPSVCFATLRRAVEQGASWGIFHEGQEAQLDQAWVDGDNAGITLDPVPASGVNRIVAPSGQSVTSSLRSCATAPIREPV